jgi:hypothetical protein
MGRKLCQVKNLVLVRLPRSRAVGDHVHSNVEPVTIAGKRNGLLCMTRRRIPFTWMLYRASRHHMLFVSLCVHHLPRLSCTWGSARVNARRLGTKRGKLTYSYALHGPFHQPTARLPRNAKFLLPARLLHTLDMPTDRANISTNHLVLFLRYVVHFWP